MFTNTKLSDLLLTYYVDGVQLATIALPLAILHYDRYRGNRFNWVILPKNLQK